MKFTQGLGLIGGESIAFVGAGGKTTAMFTLSREIKSPVLLTTSTHLGVWQAELADQHVIIASPDEIQKIPVFDRHKLLVTGPLGDDQRLAGLDMETLETIHRYCLAHGYTLLIEADGARQRPIKAPAHYEPVIPAWVDQVVVMAGLSGLGKPLNANSVHRSEIFAQLSGRSVGETIQVEDLAALLGSDVGGLKGIPDGASLCLFLNQAEGAIRMAQGGRLAHELAEHYKRVLVGSLEQPGPDGPIFSTYSTTVGIILAAGGSARLGQPKQLLDWWGEPFVRQVARNALAAGIKPLYVVLGAARALVENVLNDLPVSCVYNPDWEMGQSTSMKAGLAALPEYCERVMFLLSDQPHLPPDLMRQLIDRHDTQRAPITMPLVRGSRGNPVLFSRETFDALMSVSGDQGGRSVFKQFEVDYVDWIDTRALLDVDNEDQLVVLREAYFPDNQ